MTVIQRRLTALEEAMKPPVREFTAIQKVIIKLDAPGERLPISEDQLQRLARDGYREGVDELVVVSHFIIEAA